MSSTIWKAAIRLALALAGATLLPAQNIELSATGGLGVTAGDDQARGFTTGGGASVAWLSEGRQGLKLDYFFGNNRKDAFTQHFVTGSYVIQQRSGTARPFFQVGAGILRGDRKEALTAPSGGDTDFAAIVGCGVTLDFGSAFFIRPELRSYWYAGPTVAVLPAVSLAWRF